MNNLTQYRLLVYGFSLFVAITTTVLTMYVYPAFEYHDMCGKTIPDLPMFRDQAGQPNPMYDRPDADEIVKACYDTQFWTKNSVVFVSFGLSLFIWKMIVKKPELWGKDEQL